MNDFNDSRKKDMMKKPSKTSTTVDNMVDSKRRNFLLAAGCAPVIGVAAMLSRESAAEPLVEMAAAPVDANVSGYHETDHIRKYYRIAGHF